MNHSPMFKHSIESFEHGLEHYLDGTEKSRKFSILHIDQAVELLLKEKVVRIGKSIYKSDGNTISLHEAFNSLKDLKIPERPRLEELHDLRNTVQHKGIIPDKGSTSFYIEISYKFFKNFLSEHLATPISEVIDRRYRSLMENLEEPESFEIAEIFSKAETVTTPIEKIIAGHTALHRAAAYLSDPKAKRVVFRGTIRDHALKGGCSKEEIDKLIAIIMSLRNQVVHSAYEPSEAEVETYLDSVRQLLKAMSLIKSAN